jgi:hypothetical protein
MTTVLNLLRVFFVCLCASGLFGQTATLTGRVLDESGAVVPGAKIILGGPDGTPLMAVSAGDGKYAFTGVAPGKYSVTASAPALATAHPFSTYVGAGVQILDLQLKVVATTAQITVHDDFQGVSTEAGDNASATVLTGQDLQALSDDPEDLQADLEALAGPSSGPGGSAIFIDGFSDGQIPAKESIREIRINQNPFSPEYDKLGLGRIEIFTKPGTDKWHATVTYNLGTDRWNSRNPYASRKPPFLLQETENSFSGPLGKRTSFTLDFERQAIDNGSVINAETLDSETLAPGLFTGVLKTPQRRWRLGPHIDYQLSENNFLAVRYSWTNAAITNQGIGGFDLVSRGYAFLTTYNIAQVVETSLHGSSVNETRFQYIRNGTSSTANTTGPEIQVLGAFNGGGATYGHEHDVKSNYELQNNTSILHGTHSFRFGVRVRGQMENSFLPLNFNGTFTFPSLDAYRNTLLGIAGAGPSQFTITAGRPLSSVNRFDTGVFVGDDWRLKPNFTLNLGLRYEIQTNIHDWSDIAPRAGFAWAPGANHNQPGKTVLRGGFGIFYSRFPITYILAAARYNGIVQQQYVVTNPAFYPDFPAIEQLRASAAPQSTYELDSHLRSPYVMQSAFTAERQLPKNIALALTYTNAHSLHIWRSEDINAPLAGTYNPANQAAAIYPHPGQGPIFLIASSALYNQNQMIVNVNSKVNPAVSLFGYYVLNKAMSNSDGINTFPGNPYDYSGDYGRAATDVRHRVLAGGTISMRWNLRLNPYFTAQTGLPFDITTGNDPYGTTIFTARPGIAPDPTRPGLIQTAYGPLDPNPIPGEKLIGRNAGNGPFQIQANLRLTKTWGFGGERVSGGAQARDAAPSAGPALSAPTSTRGLFSNPSTPRRYNLTIGMTGRNLLNRTNPGQIVGTITSPLFGQSNEIAGTPNAEGFSENANNRRLEMQARFTF